MSGSRLRAAVIGMAVRLPGAETPEQFWDNNEAGAVFVRRFSPEELIAAGTPEADARDPEFVGASALTDDIAGFDADCFGMSPREAAITDPQHRLFLEVCQQALEDAGYSGAGERVAVFGSAGYHLQPLGGYLRANLDGRVFDASFVDHHANALGVAFSSYPDFIATKTAYKLGLVGPAMTIQTGCSAALVSIGQAVRALADDEADLALVASAAVHVPQVIGHRPVKGSVISRSGVCRAFDAKSDGTVSGNGAAAVVLRRLDRAQRSGDRVHATILSVSVNNDGAAKQAYAAPSADGQAAVIARAVDLAGVSTADIGYVEAHGTGTYKGDPIEFSAMDRVWRARDWTPGGCALGAVKPSIGHLDSAAGLPGLIKAIGVLRRGVIPPLPNFTAPNPSLPLDDGPFRLPAAAQQWPESDQPRRAGVTALGVGGTNAHAILEEAPPPRGRSRSRRARVPGVLPLSAADPGALRQLAADWAEYLRDHPDVELADVVTTAALGRRRMRRRLAVLGTDPDALRDGLEAYAASKESPRCLTGTVDRAAPGTAAPGSRPEYRAGHNGAVASTSQERDQRLAEAHCSGDSIEWEQVLAGFRGRRIPLPTYPFQRKPHWIGPAPRPEPAPQRSAPSSHHSPGNRGETMTTSERVLDHIQQVAAAQLGCEPADVAAGVAFTVLGADSLSLVNLANDLEKNFGVRVSMRELFEVGDTPDKLAKLVADRIDEAPPAAPPAVPPAMAPTVPLGAAPPAVPPAAPPAVPPAAPPAVAPAQVAAQAPTPPQTAPPQALGFQPFPGVQVATPPAPAASPAPPQYGASWVPVAYPGGVPMAASAAVDAHLAAVARALEGLATQLQQMAAMQTQLMHQFSQLLAQQHALLNAAAQQQAQFNAVPQQQFNAVPPQRGQ